jgi:hypothetical protein
MTDIRHESVQRTVQDIVNLYENGHLNLSPGFQRDSVWTEHDRAKLVDSIVRNYPVPSIFFYRREAEGEIIYDVIDGKQRIESILMFIGLIHGKRFSAKVQLPGEDEKNWVDWSLLRHRKKQHLITGYKLPTIEVDGDLADIIDLFVRINSTGKALTSAEKRHAKYYNSNFLRATGRVASRYEAYLRKSKILTAGQIARMKHVELICEIMISIHQEDVINKKAALDRVMEANSLSPIQTRKAQRKTVLALNRVRRIFSQLYRTRFHQVSDFYSLIVLVAKFEAEKMVLTDRRRNKLAWDLLVAFSTGVDEVRERHKKVKSPKAGQELYSEYLLTVLRGTDEISQRRKREHILRGLLQSLFERKDSKRQFSPEQRRILWNKSAIRKCIHCSKSVTWDDFTIDHIDPFSKGGRTQLENAALMCRNCNAAKGNRNR